MAGEWLPPLIDHVVLAALAGPFVSRRRALCLKQCERCQEHQDDDDPQGEIK
jgi:hypothetical protein